ncbi:MAG: diguanylate cyclase [Hyphomicrobiaceae bacterium]
MREIIESKSLRFWIALALFISIAPLAISAIGGFVLLDRGVISPFHDIASRHRKQIMPSQELRTLMWDTLVPVDEYIEDRNALHSASYRDIRTRIAGQFANVIEAFEQEPRTQELLERAQGMWTKADDQATRVISEMAQANSPEILEAQRQFHAEVEAASDILKSVAERIATAVHVDHDQALLQYERAIWISIIAGIVCLIAISVSMFMVGRIIGSSVDRLVDGASRFADGDRFHRIDIQVPPELGRVANEFNLMIERIRDTEADLAALANADSLTRLANRRAFDAIFAEEAARRKRYGGSMSLLAIDLDRFKNINDTHGHNGGDEVLRAAAKILSASIRPVDRLFRIGGEEFAVILPHTELAGACDAAERLRQAIESMEVVFNGKAIPVTTSIGVALVADNMTQESAMQAADSALYQAKKTGRNKVVVNGLAPISSKTAA